jgi:hypothetical protein
MSEEQAWQLAIKQLERIERTIEDHAKKIYGNGRKGFQQLCEDLAHRIEDLARENTQDHAIIMKLITRDREELKAVKKQLAKARGRGGNGRGALKKAEQDLVAAVLASPAVRNVIIGLVVSALIGIAGLFGVNLDQQQKKARGYHGPDRAVVEQPKSPEPRR